jgi:hypothetical protein
MLCHTSVVDPFKSHNQISILVSQPLLLNYSHNTCSLNLARTFNLVCLFEVGHKAYCTICKFNLQERLSLYKNDLPALEPLQPYFKSRKGICQTSLRWGIFNKIRHQFFSLQFAQPKKAKKLLPTSYVRGQLFNVSSTKNSFLVHK